MSFSRCTTDEVTPSLIAEWKRDAGTAGDLAMVMICDLATDGPEALEGAEPGTDADRLLQAGRTQEWALAEIARCETEARASREEE